MKVSQAWLGATALACDGEITKATPKTLRYRLLRVPAVIVRGQRRRRLRIPRPWADEIVTAFHRLPAPPHST